MNVRFFAHATGCAIRVGAYRDDEVGERRTYRDEEPAQKERSAFPEAPEYAVRVTPVPPTRVLLDLEPDLAVGIEANRTPAPHQWC